MKLSKNTTNQPAQLPGCMMLYHVTTKENAEHIKKEGLKPSIGPRSEKAGEKEAKVYLFKDKTGMENAVTNWLGDKFDEDEALICITFAIPRHFTINLEYNINAQFEITSHVTIPAEFISEIHNI